MAALVEYSCADEHICDCNCPNRDCIHNKENRKDFYYERNNYYRKRKLPGADKRN